MIGADLEGRDFLFPSNQTALELYEQAHGSPMRSEIVFNTPIVLYTRQEVAQAMQEIGLVRNRAACNMLMWKSWRDSLRTGCPWAEIGLPQLYGNVAVFHHGSVQVQFRQYVRGPACQCIGRRRGGEEEDLPDLLPRLKDVFANWDIWKARQRICSISF